jgi:Coenzyme PQQ synthesis protein D (PqqD)
MILDKSSAIDHRTIGGEAFVITAEDSRIHSLNETASFVFDRCDGKTPIAHIVDALVETFDVQKQQAEEDVSGFVRDLLARGMLVER